MLLSLPASHMAWARVGWARYLCLQIDGRTVVVNDRCRHRGGPLSLGTWDSKRCAIVCPWHGNYNGRAHLARKALPSVRVGTVVHALVATDLDDSAPHGRDA